ncbi:MAG: DUF2842 domain-containing protein [Pseudomonadota bacterium]
MTPRIKKLIGLFILLPGLLLYVGAVVTLADFAPAFWLAKLVFFIASGLAWALPVIPLMTWMNREPRRKNERAPNDSAPR